MYHLHCTKKLLDRIKPTPPTADASTTQLGNWYASPGIQLVDLLLWIVRQIDKGQPPGPGSIRLFHEIGHRTRVFELSLRHISDWTEAAWEKINRTEMPDEQLQKGAELLAQSERRRRAAMAAYIAAKSAPAPTADLLDT